MDKVLSNGIHKIELFLQKNGKVTRGLVGSNGSQDEITIKEAVGYEKALLKKGYKVTEENGKSISH